MTVNIHKYIYVSPDQATSGPARSSVVSLVTSCFLEMAIKPSKVKNKRGERNGGGIKYAGARKIGTSRLRAGPLVSTRGGCSPRYGDIRDMSLGGTSQLFNVLTCSETASFGPRGPKSRYARNFVRPPRVLRRANIEILPQLKSS